MGIDLGVWSHDIVVGLSRAGISTFLFFTPEPLTLLSTTTFIQVKLSSILLTSLASDLLIDPIQPLKHPLVTAENSYVKVLSQKSDMLEGLLTRLHSNPSQRTTSNARIHLTHFAQRSTTRNKMPVDWKDPEAYNRLFAAMLAANDMKVSLLASYRTTHHRRFNATKHLLFLCGLLCHILSSIKFLFMFCEHTAPALALQAGNPNLNPH